MPDSCEQCAVIPKPIRPRINLPAAGGPLELWRGDLSHSLDGMVSVAPGSFHHRWTRRGPHLIWQADTSALGVAEARPWYHRPGIKDPYPIALYYAETSSTLPSYSWSDGTGWTNGGYVGNQYEAVPAVVAHWMNLPAFGGYRLHRHDQDDSWFTWRGLTEFVAAGWRIRFDEVEQHRQSYERAEREETVLPTHVMELRREDEALFSAEEAKTILDGLQTALSFALGYWVAAIAPTGTDSHGNAVWAHWQPLRVDPPRRTGWWDRLRVNHDLQLLLDSFLACWLKPTEHDVLNLAVAAAVQAVETGFVEQRLMTAVSGLEMLHWATFERDAVDTGQQTNSQKLKTWQRITELLKADGIDVKMNPNRTPLLLNYGKSNNSRTDAPWVIANIRNRITHPKDLSDLYANPQILSEACRLALHYLELTILHRIGYTGRIADRTQLDRSASDTEPVPWAMT